MFRKLCSFSLAITLATTAIANAQEPVVSEPDAAHAIYVPIYRSGEYQPPTFSLQVLQIDEARLAECLAEMSEAGPARSGADFCPLPGAYISLVASNPGSLAMGGKRDLADVAWRGDGGKRIAPAQVIADVDIVEVAENVGGYDTSSLFTASTTAYTVIEIQDTSTAARNAQQLPMFPEGDFVEIMREMIYKGGERFEVIWPGSQVFWDSSETFFRTPSNCGYPEALWIPSGRTRIIVDQGPVHFLAHGKFSNGTLNTCMGVHQWVKVADLRSSPQALELRTRVEQRRGNTAPIIFNWFADARSQVYAFWATATGTLAYYGYTVLNAGANAPSPAMFLFVPTDMLTCSTVGGVKTCLVQQGQPEVQK